MFSYRLPRPPNAVCTRPRPRCTAPSYINRKGARHRAVGDQAIRGERSGRRGNLREHVAAGTETLQLEALEPELIAKSTEPSNELRAETEDAHLFRVVFVYQQSVEVQGPALGLRAPALPLVSPIGVSDADPVSRDDDHEKQKRKHPVRRSQQTDDTHERRPALHHLRQRSEDLLRSVRSLELRAVKRVVVPRVFVVGEIDANRLLVQHAEHAVRHRLALGRGRQRGQRAGTRGSEPDQGSDADQHEHVRERRCGGFGQQPGSDRIDDQLHHVQRRQGQHRLHEDERDAEDGPARRTLPHQHERPAQPKGNGNPLP